MTSISSPTSLATFQYAQASSSKSRQTHITLTPVLGASSPLAVAAVQGDGVWTYDLTTLRPTASFAVPPSTTFVSSPLSFFPHRQTTSKEKGKGPVDPLDDAMAGASDSSSRITAVVIDQGEKVRRGEERRVLWVWGGDEGSDKERLLLDIPILKLLHVPHSRAAMLCVHTNGSISAIDSNLQIRPVHLQSAFQLKGVPMTAEVTHVGESTVNITLVSSRGSMVVVQLDLSGGRDIQAKVVKEGSFGVGKKEKDMKAVEIDASGRLVGIGHHSSILSQSLDSLTKPDILPTLALPPSVATVLPIPSKGLPLSLLATASCDLLLCSVSSTLPAVLNISHLSEVSPTTNAYISHLSILHQASGLYTIGVVLTHRDDDGGRSVIYIMEVTIPEAGIGINALLGTEVETKKHLVIPTQASKVETTTDDIVTTVQDHLAGGKVAEAEERFEDWMKQKEVQRNETKSKTPFLSAEAVEQVITAVFTTASKAADEEMPDGNAIEAVVLQDEIPRKPLAGPYAAAIIRRLLKARLVKNEMWPGGVMEAGLLLANDWDNVRYAIPRIPSLPSTAIVSILEHAYTRSADDRESADRFTSIIQDILALSSPAPDYRAALSALSVEACSALLDTYLSWLDEHASRVPSSLDSWLSPDKPSVPDPKIPALESIILHSNLLLDARLHTLLSHQPAWETLEKMQIALGSLMDVQETYRKIRAPIDAVLTLSKREAKRRSDEEAKRKVLITEPGQGHQKGQLDRKGRNRKYEGANEEAVGKWRVEDLMF